MVIKQKMAEQMNTFEDLEVWKLARELRKSISKMLESIKWLYCIFEESSKR